MKVHAVADLSRHQAKLRPGAMAIMCRGQGTTYGELDMRASRVANGLLSVGVEKGARIAYLGKNSEVYFELLLGAAKARCTMVPLNWRLAAPEVDFIVNDSEPYFIATELDYVPVLQTLTGDPHILIVDGPPETGYAAWRDRQSADDPALATDPEDTVVIMYTSGTTGLPKGAQLTDKNLMSHLYFIESGAFGQWSEADIQLICLPIFHIGGTDSGLWSFYTGATNLLLRDANTKTIIDAFAQWPVTIAGFVPTIMRSVLEHPDVHKRDFSSLKLISYGGSPISPELMQVARETFQCRLQQLFGMTETTGGVVILVDEDHRGSDPARLRSCGRPLPTVDVRIVDPEGTEKATGEAGEIAVRGPMVTKGYWRRPEETEKALRDGWFRTGDVGYFDEWGYLFIRDRIKDMIVSGGENIYPTEVENALSRHEGIAEIAVIGVPDERWGEAVKAFVVMRPDCGATAGELMAFARARLAGYKCPKSIDFVDSLPRNASGKILRRELRKQYWGGGDRQIA